MNRPMKSADSRETEAAAIEKSEVASKKLFFKMSVNVVISMFLLGIFLYLV
ncbi:hypothetical protein SDC9_119094 [bioreactor metagenome]|uniref:Uncharacterized protein n=1 Tax=bioreactor metagenome TaxID=1076179 RepID=A0A645C568_9ZZZZ